MGFRASVRVVRRYGTDRRAVASRQIRASDLDRPIFFSTIRSDPGRRRGAREAEWFEWALTVISMRPAGWPPMDMSKKQTGLDIVIVEFACGSDLIDVSPIAFYEKSRQPEKPGKRGKPTAARGCAPSASPPCATAGTPTAGNARAASSGIRNPNDDHAQPRHPPWRRVSYPACSTRTATGPSETRRRSVWRGPRSRARRPSPTPRRASAGCRSPGSSSPSTRSRKRRRRRGWVR